MGLRFKDQNLGECFFLTTSFDNQKKLGNVTGVFEALAESLNHRIEKTESRLISYVFMPSHIHLLLCIKGDKLEGFMRDFKKFTAQKTIRDIVQSRKVWQGRYDRQAIWSEKILMTKIRYVHDNPVRSGLVEEPEAWYYSSAADYAGRQDGPVKIWKGWHR
jgi:REP element-mobilizing transposase RayT